MKKENLVSIKSFERETQVLRRQREDLVGWRSLTGKGLRTVCPQTWKQWTKARAIWSKNEGHSSNSLDS